MSTETLSRNRYARTFVCAACNKLAVSEKSHATTCSPACRTRLHRHPDLSGLKAVCAASNVPIAMVLEAEAVRRLAPELAQHVAAGRMTLEECRSHTFKALLKLIEEVRNEG